MKVGDVLEAMSIAVSDSIVLGLLLLYPITLFCGVFFLLALVQDHGAVTAGMCMCLCTHLCACYGI